MMLYPTMPELLKYVNSRYLLVNVIAKRAREISAAANDEGTSLDEKPVSLAIKEIAAGKITEYMDLDLETGAVDTVEAGAESEPELEAAG